MTFPDLARSVFGLKLDNGAVDVGATMKGVADEWQDYNNASLAIPYIPIRKKRN